MWQGLELKALDLACERGGRVVFEGLNFTVKSGAHLELRGPNGSGKSSLLRLLAGLNHPSAGTVHFNDDAEFAEQAHYLGHGEAIKPALSVEENLQFWRRYLGQAQDVSLSTFKLDKLKNDPARLLSEGQRRRLALSRLISAPRPLWLLDEPTVGLDKYALRDLYQAMHKHMTDGGMIIAATHIDLELPNRTQLLFGEAA